MKNQFVFLGICCGMIIGLVVVALLFKKKVLDVTFDERQERIRGMAYKYAFFTLMIAVTAHWIWPWAAGATLWREYRFVWARPLRCLP